MFETIHWDFVTVGDGAAEYIDFSELTNPLGLCDDVGTLRDTFFN